jgi:hypothetical protein
MHILQMQKIIHCLQLKVIGDLLFDVGWFLVANVACNQKHKNQL